MRTSGVARVIPLPFCHRKGWGRPTGFSKIQIKKNGTNHYSVILHLKRKEKKGYNKFGVREAVSNQKSKGMFQVKNTPKMKIYRNTFKSEIFKFTRSSIRILKGAVEKRCKRIFGSSVASYTCDTFVPTFRMNTGSGICLLG